MKNRVITVTEQVTAVQKSAAPAMEGDTRNAPVVKEVEVSNYTMLGY